MMAVREEEDAAESMGVSALKHKLIALAISAFFTGLAGGAFAYFHVGYYYQYPFSPAWSLDMLTMVYIGGQGTILGPIIGAIVFIFFFAALSGFTKAWLLYLGLFFLVIVLYAPGGLASLLVMQLPVIRAGRWRELAGPYAIAAATALVALAGLIGLVEMVYRLSDPASSPEMALFGIGFNAHATTPWIVFGALLLAGLVALRIAARQVGERWGVIQESLAARQP